MPVKEISVKELTKMFNKEELLKEHKKEVFEAILDGCLESIKGLAEISPLDTGLYAASWEVDHFKFESVWIGNTAPYAEQIEYGSRPFSPPIEPLIQWAGRKLNLPEDHNEVRGLAFGIKRKFEREGMMPKHIMEKGLDTIVFPLIKGRLDRL